VNRRVAPAIGARVGDRPVRDRATELRSPHLGDLESRPGAGADRGAIIVGEGGVDLQRKGVIDSQLDHAERHGWP
jgi:ribosome biogenesis SPOUT family RNA methylase Rps3